MPSLINTTVGANYRKSAPSTQIGTPQLIHALITISNIDASDYDVVDGNFFNIINIIQKFGEIYAIGDVQFGEGGSSVTVILKAGTMGDTNYSNTGNYDPVNQGSVSLQYDLQQYFEQSVSIYYTTMYGLQYN
jgi:hypothetical protein